MIDINLFIPIAQAAEVAVESEKSGVIGTFGINWMLFIAQLINFSIVVFVLKKYAFGPIAKKLQERSEKIEIALQDAKKIELEKEEFEQWKNEEMQKSRKEAGVIITDAEKEAETIKAETINKTKKEQEKILAQAQSQIASEQEKMIATIKTEVAEMVTKASEKVIKTKLDSKADQEIIKKSLDSLR